MSFKCQKIKTRLLNKRKLSKIGRLTKYLPYIEKLSVINFVIFTWNINSLLICFYFLKFPRTKPSFSLFILGFSSQF